MLLLRMLVTLSWVLLVGTASVGYAASTIIPSAPAAHLDAEELLLIDLINSARQQQGLAPMWAVSCRLTQAADSHSRDLLAQGAFQGVDLHVGSNGWDTGERLVYYGWNQIIFSAPPGEIVYYGSGNRAVAGATAALAWWMASSPHRADILRPSHAHIGVGRACNAAETTCVWTGVFSGQSPYGSSVDNGCVRAWASDAPPPPPPLSPPTAGNLLVIANASTGWVALGHPNRPTVSQSFQAPATTSVSDFTVWLVGRDRPTSSLVFSIRATPAGPNLGSVTVTPQVGQNAGAPTAVSAQLASPVPLQQGQTYWATVQAVTPNANDYYLLAVNDKNPYQQGALTGYEIPAVTDARMTIGFGPLSPPDTPPPPPPPPPPPSPTGGNIVISGTSNGFVVLGHPSRPTVNQSFQAPLTGNVAGLTVYLVGRDRPTSPLVVALRATATGPDLGSVILTPPVGTNPGVPTAVYAQFPAPVPAEQGRTYWIGLTATAPNANDYYWLAVNDRNPYAQGSLTGPEIPGTTDARITIEFAP